MTEKEREGYNLLKVSSRDRHLLQRHKPLTKNKNLREKSNRQVWVLSPSKNKQCFPLDRGESENKLLHLL